MISFLLISIYAILKGVSDTLKVSQTFDNSWFIKYKGVKWIDPLVTKPETKWILLRPFHACFRDLWHTIWTINTYMYIFLLYKAFGVDSYLNWWQFSIAFFLIYGYLFEYTLAQLKYFKPIKK